MKRILPLVIFAFCVTIAFSQEYHWSNDLSLGGRLPHTQPMGENAQGYLLLKQNSSVEPKHIRFDYLDKDLIEKSSFEVKNPKKGVVYNAFFSYHSKILAFYSKKSFSDGSNVIFGTAFGTDGSQLFSPVQIGEVALRSYGDPGNYLVSSSPSGAYLVCVLQNKENTNASNIILLDSNLNILKQTVVDSCDFNDENPNRHSIWVDDAGHFSLASINENRAYSKDNPLRYSVLLVSWNKDSTNAISFSQSFPFHFIDEISILGTGEPGMFYVGGLTSSDRSSSPGFWLGKFGVADVGLQFSNINYVADSLIGWANGHTGDWGQRGVSKTFNLRQMVLSESDHGVYFVLEEVYNYAVSNYSSGGVGYPNNMTPWSGNNTKTVYVYGDLIVNAFDSSGKKMWERGIEKKQTTGVEESYYMGYSLFQLKEGLVFLFSDKSASPYIDLKGVFIDRTGNLLFKPSFFNHPKNCFLVPSESSQLSNRGGLLHLDLGNKSYYVKVTF